MRLRRTANRAVFPMGMVVIVIVMMAMAVIVIMVMVVMAVMMVIIRSPMGTAKPGVNGRLFFDGIKKPQIQ